MYYDKKKVIIVVGILIVFVLWFYFASRDDVSDIRDGAEPIREEYRRAESVSREQTEEIGRAGQAVEESRRINQEIRESEQRDTGAIESSEQILRRIRARGPAQNGC